MLEIGNGHNEVHLTSNKIDFDGTIRFKVVRPICDFILTLGTLSQTKSNLNLGMVVSWDSLHAEL